MQKFKKYLWKFKRLMRSAQRNLALMKLIRNKRILIVGSGYSAIDLDRLPPDVKIFTCNRGLKLFLDKKLAYKISLYFVGKIAMDQYDDIMEMLKKVSVGIVITDDWRYLKKKAELKIPPYRIIVDSNNNPYYPKRLIKPYTIEQIIRSSYPKTSTGLRLLQYALCFRAKEIYMIGIDLSEDNYFWNDSTGGNKQHSDIDRKFLKIVSQRHNNIYSLSKRSPATNYIRYKSFEATNAQ